MKRESMTASVSRVLVNPTLLLLSPLRKQGPAIDQDHEPLRRTSASIIIPPTHIRPISPYAICHGNRSDAIDNSYAARNPKAQKPAMASNAMIPMIRAIRGMVGDG